MTARLLVILTIAATAAGCKGPRIVQTYAGPSRDVAGIARLYETPAASVTRIDGAKASGRDLWGRTTAYDLLPGRHEIVVARPGKTVRHWAATFDYDFAAGREYGFRVTQLRRDDGAVIEWSPRLVDYETAQELASPQR